MPDLLLSNENYVQKNYAKALEETFVELDYLLLSDEGFEKMKGIVLQMKQAARGPAAKLDLAEEKEVRALPF